VTRGGNYLPSITGEEIRQKVPQSSGKEPSTSVEPEQKSREEIETNNGSCGLPLKERPKGECGKKRLKKPFAGNIPESHLNKTAKRRHPKEEQQIDDQRSSRRNGKARKTKGKRLPSATRSSRVVAFGRDRLDGVQIPGCQAPVICQWVGSSKEEPT